MPAARGRTWQASSWGHFRRGDGPRSALAVCRDRPGDLAIGPVGTGSIVLRMGKTSVASATPSAPSTTLAARRPGRASRSRRDTWRFRSWVHATKAVVRVAGLIVGTSLLATAHAHESDGGAWREISIDTADLGPRFGHTAVWTGKEMLVWGGRTAAGPLGDGARFDPHTSRWRPISRAGAPWPRWGHTAIWTGAEMLLWGGVNLGASGSGFADGAAYSPATDAWRPLPATGAPSGRWAHAATWTGHEMLVWGGTSFP